MSDDDLSTQHPLEVVGRLLAGVQHSAPSIKKYRAFEQFAARYMGVDPLQAYTAFISKASNVSVRFDQSKRSRSAHVLIALLDPELTEDPALSVEALRRYCFNERQGAEGLIFQYRDDQWIPYAGIVPNVSATPHVDAFLNLTDFGSKVVYDVANGASLELKWGKRAQSRPVRFSVFDSEDAIEFEDVPFVALVRDDWDDYGLKTLFSAYLYVGEGWPAQKISLGEVKILEQGQMLGPTDVPRRPFQELGPQYCSVGQSFSYYEKLLEQPEYLMKAVLRGLRDAAFDSGIREQFADEIGFENSLKRTGQAARALEDADSIFNPPVDDDAAASSSTSSEHLDFAFTTSVGGSAFTTRFNFNFSEVLPDRINAVIGYNGCGKTHLLANLALVATSDPDQRRRFNRYGQIEGAVSVRFSSVIAISYSAFDTFVLPDGIWRKGAETQRVRKRLEDLGDAWGYAYCGLRKWTEDEEDELANIGDSSDPQPVAPRGLKSIDEITEEFASALERARSSQKMEAFTRAVGIIREEPSFALMGLDVYLDEDSDAWRPNFEGLSTGHKIVLNILTQIIAHSNPGSLVLIDEPESHLHPSLLAALMRAVNVVLQMLDSYAIVATHSPVVLQEIPRRYVRILQRFGDSTQVMEPLTETFGENVGYLTTNVFDLDSRKTDYHDVLERLSKRLTVEQIDDLFGGEMSMQARAYVLSLKRQGRR